MSDLSSTSYGRDTKCDTGNNSMLMIILLLCMCGGLGGDSCSSDNGLGGMLPLILILCMCGGF